MAARYFDAIRWIARNDSAGEADAQEVASVQELITVALVADIFGKTDAEVATDVVRCRAYQGHANVPKKYQLPEGA